MPTQVVILSPQENFSFPVGYHNFHKNKDINFQLNRFYSFGYWTKADAEEAGKAIQEIKDWKQVLTGLAKRHKVENRPLAASFSYRAAEFYTLPSDPDKIRLYDQFNELFYTNLPAQFHLIYLPELVIQTLAFSWLPVTWEHNNGKKLLTIPLIIVFSLIVIMIIMGLFLPPA